MAEIKGIERIKARILAEANEYAAAKDAERLQKSATRSLQSEPPKAPKSPSRS